MQRSYPPASRNRPSLNKEHIRETAIHEAGHAAAIYLGNRLKQLPPVYFQIKLKEFRGGTCVCKTDTHWFAEIEGGRLIQSLPPSADEIAGHFSTSEKEGFVNALEADIFNLLAGPLAEANYVALRDDEIINPYLVNLDSLYHYGGSADMKIVQEHIECLSSIKSGQEQKMSELFLLAFQFINDRAVWRAIIGLANHILSQKNNVISYEEIIAVLDANFFSHRNFAFGHPGQTALKTGRHHMLSDGEVMEIMTMVGLHLGLLKPLDLQLKNSPSTNQA